MNETIAFYRDTLGFEVTAAYPDYDPEFCSLKGGGAVAMFTRAGSNGVNSLYIYPALWEEIRNAATVEYLPRMTEYVMREFGICDPTRYLWRFGHDLSRDRTHGIPEFALPAVGG